MTTRNRDEASAAPAQGRVLRLVRDLPADQAPDAAPDAQDPEASKRRRSPSALVRMMQNWSDAIDRDVAFILES